MKLFAKTDSKEKEQIEEMIDKQLDPMARGVCMILFRKVEELEDKVL